MIVSIMVERRQTEKLQFDLTAISGRFFYENGKIY